MRKCKYCNGTGKKIVPKVPKTYKGMTLPWYKGTENICFGANDRCNHCSGTGNVKGARSCK